MPPRKRAARPKGRPSRSQRARSAPTPVFTVEFVAIAVSLVVGGLLFWRATADPFGVPRWTLILLTGVFLLGVWAAEGAKEARWPALPRRAWWILTAFLIAAVVAALHAPDHAIALYGVPFRQNGVLSYFAYAFLFVAAAQLRTRKQWSYLTFLLAATGLGVIGYGLLQWAGWDPFSWPNAQLGTVFSTLGQVNFASGYVAIVSPFLLLLALRSDIRIEVRALAAAVLAAGALYLYVTRSFQGIPAGLVGALPLLWVVARGRVVAGRSMVTLGAVAVCAAVGLLVLLPPTRHYVRDNLDSGFEERLLLWDAGGRMLGENPVFGKGFASYAAEFTPHRPARHALLVGRAIADEPHSVPLEMAVNGGLVLLLAYLAFIAYVGVAFVVGLKREPSLLLAAIGGGWLAYQVQALVSFDSPPLASLHWILAGGIVALTWGQNAESPHRNKAASPNGLAVGAGIAVILGIWLSAPLRADLSAHRADEQVHERRPDLAASSFEHATKLAPWNGVYWADLATTYQVLGRKTDALEAGAKAIEHSPGSIGYVLAEAKLAASHGRYDAAEHWYRVATRTDPRYAGVWLDYGRFELLRGLPSKALAPVRRAIELSEDAGGWDVLSNVYRALGRPSDADFAARRADRLRSGKT